MCANYLDERQAVVLSVKLDFTLKILWGFFGLGILSVLSVLVTLR